MFTTESRMIRLDFFNINSPAKVFRGMPLLKLCPLFADTYGREGDRSKKSCKEIQGKVRNIKVYLPFRFGKDF